MAEFECEMNKMKGLESGEAAHDWLMNMDINKWVRHTFTIRINCDMLLNNLCECFNSWILQARDKPILTMLEMIRCNPMRRLQVKNDSMRGHEQPICPTTQNKLDKFKSLSTKYVSMYSGNGLFQVRESIADQYVVDLSRRRCCCNGWDLTSIPCHHVVATIFRNREDAKVYVDPYYTNETYMRAYEPIFNPIIAMHMWLMM